MATGSIEVKHLELTGPATPVLEEVSSDPASGYAQIDVATSGTLVYLPGKPAMKTLAWLDSTGHTQPFRVAAAEYVPIPHFSPDGKRLALGIVEGGNTDVWVYEWERDAMTR